MFQQIEELEDVSIWKGLCWGLTDWPLKSNISNSRNREFQDVSTLAFWYNTGQHTHITKLFFAETCSNFEMMSENRIATIISLFHIHTNV